MQLDMQCQVMQVGVRGLEAPSRGENLLRGAGAAAGRLSCVCLSVRHTRPGHFLDFWSQKVEQTLYSCPFWNAILRFQNIKYSIRFLLYLRVGATPLRSAMNYKGNL